MAIRKNALTLGLVVGLLMTARTPAKGAPGAEGEVTLKAGDPAPPLQLGKWLKGEPVRALEKGTIYVIECWATWCGPCVASMPHVTKMQAKYADKGVVVIGVNVMERDPSAPEPFVKKMGNKMGYRVVADDTSDGPEKGKMAMTWLTASGQQGIPCSFLIDRQGKIAWIGHPLSLERPLAALVDGKFDPAEQAAFEKKVEGISEELLAARQAKDRAKAMAALDQLTKLEPGLAMYYGINKLSFLLEGGDYAAANALAPALADENQREGGSERMLANIASTLLEDAPDPAKVDAAVALRIAAAAYEADKDDWRYQALLARAYAANKQFDKAAQMQAKALETIPAQIKEGAEKALAEYKEKAGQK